MKIFEIFKKRKNRWNSSWQNNKKMNKIIKKKQKEKYFD